MGANGPPRQNGGGLFDGDEATVISQTSPIAHEPVAPVDYNDDDDMGDTVLVRPGVSDAAPMSQPGPMPGMAGLFGNPAQMSAPVTDQRFAQVHGQMPMQRMTPMPQPAQDNRLSALQSLSLSRGRDSAEPSTGHARSSRLPWILLAVVLGVVLVVWLVPRLRGSGESNAAAIGSSSSDPATEIVSSTSSDGKSLHAAGYVAARAPIVVGSVIAGRVKALLVKEGDSVQKNQVLAQLDDSAALADYSLAHARLRDAQRILDRTQQLRKVDGVTAADLDRAIGQVEIARASLAPIARQIEDAKIRSPVDGTILEELVQAGSIIVGNAGVFRLADLSKLVAEIDVNEADVSLVQVDQKVDITSDAFSDQTFSGVVRELGEQVDRAKGTIIVKVFLETPPKTLRPGMSVKANFQPAGGKARMLIPKTAVDESGNVSVVGSDGKITTKHVSTQKAGPTKLEVLDGLANGDRIVVDPHAPHAP